ncbi:MAG: sulfotransferase family 2 domain-containing protein [Shimia sp.]|uniref:sulfotransferase family 2 domain-containing protein n=1 Tax=Shimia sp. TaxID=1954381 RepID=UPI00405A243C
MLLSLSHKFLFVHVPKTAGSAIHDTLQPYAVTQERTLLRSLSRKLPTKENPSKAHFRIHDTAAHIRQKLGADVYDSFLSFAVVRNPFDHAVSHFEYMKQYRSPKIAQQFADLDFLSYLKLRSVPRRAHQRIFAYLPDQAYFLVDENDSVMVRQVIKFENLEAGLKRLCEDLGLEYRSLPKYNVTKSRNSKVRKTLDYFGPQEVSLVQEIYKRDFALFDYDSDLGSLKT